MSLNGKYMFHRSPGQRDLNPVPVERAARRQAYDRDPIGPGNASPAAYDAS